MIKVLEKLYKEKVILDHGMEVGKELANVLSGGETTIDKTLSEDDLFKLELNSFMRLIETNKTQERIKYTLATGKPLINWTLRSIEWKKNYFISTFFYSF